VKGRCTGTATSTFAGGGGTKVFCSQALTAKPARQAAAPFCAAVPYDFRRAGEREAIISGASIGFLFCKRLYSKTGFPPSHENSNNLLAAEPESENDVTRFF
jgi:hypothetical protein